MARASEDQLIARYFAPIAGAGAFELKDDAAALTPPPGCDLVVTKDALVAGVHFFADDPPDRIARKALRVNLSDLAAKGAEPCGFLLALALPQDWREEWLARFADGLREDAKIYDCALLGGDTVFTPGPLSLSITAIGQVPKGRMVLRHFMQPADRLYVSGTIGDGALGLLARRRNFLEFDRETQDFLCERYLLPQPRLSLTKPLRAFARAAMDISDGLVGDLAKMARASGVGAEVDLGRIPYSLAALTIFEQIPSLRPTALTGGDDYEILCSVAPENTQDFENAAASAGVRVTHIGCARGTSGVDWREGDGPLEHFENPSFQHF